MYYGQDTELNLLIQILQRLDNKRVIDVGAERGSFVQALLEAGAESVYAIEPYPLSASVLRERFGETPAVHILEMALGERNELATLHIIKSRTESESDSYHSLVSVQETALLHNVDEIEVECHTLEWLIAENRIPREVGILKIDAERSDFAILRGMGSLSSAVIMLEFWDSLQDGVGETPYRVDDLVAFLQDYGYADFVLVKRNNECEMLQLNHPFTRTGDWGNIIFIHKTVFGQLAPLIYAAVQEAQTRLADKVLYYHSECEKRLEVINTLQRAVTAFQEAQQNTPDPVPPLPANSPGQPHVTPKTLVQRIGEWLGRA